MLDERPACLPVLAAPFHIGKIRAVTFDQQARPAIGQCIDHRGRTSGRIIVDLRPRAIDVAGVEELREPIVGAVERTRDQRRDMRRAQKAVPRQQPDDLHVVVGEAEGRRLRRTAEPRPTNLFGSCLDRHSQRISRVTDPAFGEACDPMCREAWHCTAMSLQAVTINFYCSAVAKSANRLRQLLAQRSLQRTIPRCRP